MAITGATIGAAVGARAAQLIRERRWTLPTVCLQHILNWREERYYARHGEIGLQLAPYFCQPDKDAVDAGANDGRYVHVFKRYARRVYAFEPLPSRAQALKAKFLRDIDRQKVFIKAVALSRSRGTRMLHAPAADMLSGQDVPVRTEALDHFHLNEVGLIRLDVAGHEDNVLAGASRTILGCQPRVQIDIGESDPSGMTGHLVNWFRRLEYRGYFISQRAILSIERFPPSATESPPSVGPLFFLPPSEPEATLRRIAAHLARP